MRALLLVTLTGCIAPPPADEPDAPTPEAIDPDGPPFVRWTDQAGLGDVPLGGHGVAAADVDGDGQPDLFVPGLRSEADSCSHRLYLNRGGTFEDVSAQWLPCEQPHSAPGATLADYDNDGDPDLFLARIGPDQVWRNDGDRFVVVDAGIGGPADAISASMALGDYDADGWLDLYAVRHELVGLSGPGQPRPPDALYRNRGDGTFEDTSALLPAEMLLGAGFAAAWTDPDGDGDLDLYVVNDFGLDLNAQYYRNAGGTFQWFPNCGCALAMDGMGVAVGDYDGDERVDFWVSDRFGEHLLHNEGGTFVDATAAAGGIGGWQDEDLGTAWGPEFLDFDRDGWLDGVLAYGDELAHEVAPNRLLRNVGGRFEQVESGFEVEHDTRGVARLDFDGDGCEDLAFHGPTGFELYRNRCAPAGWLGIQLEGPASSRTPGGARVTVRTAAGVQTRELSVGSSSVHSSSSPTLLFGLGEEDEAEVEVVWPVSGLQSYGVLHSELRVLREG